MSSKHINIKFPISEGDKGYYFGSNETTKDAIVSDILHILVTKKGERFFDTNFGTNLHEFLFEPNDSLTIGDIKRELSESLSYVLPNVKILTLDVNRDEVTREAINVMLTVVDTDDVFLEKIDINLYI